MNIAEVGKLAAFVVPLGVDTFAIAAAVGASGLKPEARRRITALFVAFEAGMPLVGLALGAPLAHVIGGGRRVRGRCGADRRRRVDGVR